MSRSNFVPRWNPKPSNVTGRETLAEYLARDGKVCQVACAYVPTSVITIMRVNDSIIAHAAMDGDGNRRVNRGYQE